MQKNAQDIFSNPILGPSFFPHWLVSLGGIPLIGLATAHALVSHAKVAKILGAIVSSIIIFKYVQSTLRIADTLVHRPLSFIWRVSFIRVVELYHLQFVL